MSQKNYDIIIIGESLASRLAAVRLAKQGYRILTFRPGEFAPPKWLFSSLHLENLLESLDGKSCFTPAAPFQVFTPQVRIEVNGRMPLEEELRRELPGAHEPVGMLLAQLAAGGKRLETMLQKNGRALLTPASRALLKMRRLISRTGLGPLDRPLRAHLDASISDSQARQALETLFGGMALTPADELTVAEAALLWHCATRPSGISVSGLDDLLEHRYEQFHGETESIEAIKNIDGDKRKLDGIVLKHGGRCAATCYLLADGTALDLLPGEKRFADATGVQRRIAAPLDDQLSPLLARRVLVAGEPPLRLAIGKRDGDTACIIDRRSEPLQAGDPEKYLRQRLTEVFPFAEYDVEEAATAEVPHVAARSRRLLGLAEAPRLNRNAWICSGARLLPALGACGETLLGEALALELAKRLKKSSSLPAAT